MRGHRQLTSSSNQSWATPVWLFDKLNSEFHFTLDPCASDLNHKCSNYFTVEQDGLARTWEDQVVYINPPYNEQNGWINKAFHEFQEHGVTSVLLLPSRTDKIIFHELIAPYASQVRFLKGRIKFVGAEHGSTFPSCLVIFSSHRYSERFIFVDYR